MAPPIQQTTPTTAPDAVSFVFGAEAVGHPMAEALWELGQEHLEPHLSPDYAVDFAPEMSPVQLDGVTLPELSPLAAMELLRSTIRTPALPEILMHLLNLLSSNRATFDNVAQVVQMDPALSAMVLKTVNSASFGLHTPVSSLPQAIGLLGLTELTSMVMGSMYLAQLKPDPECPFDMSRYWRHSLAVGVIAQETAKALNLQAPQRYYLAGLLHDIGRMVLYANIKGFATAVEASSQLGGKSLHDVERQACGFDHAAFGGTLLHSWDVSPGLIELVHRHHDPLGAQHERVEVIHVADVLAGLLGHGPHPKAATPKLILEAWDSLGLSARVLPELMHRIEPTLERTFRILGGVAACWDHPPQ